MTTPEHTAALRAAILGGDPAQASMHAAALALRQYRETPRPVTLAQEDARHD